MSFYTKLEKVSSNVVLELFLTSDKLYDKYTKDRLNSLTFDKELELLYCVDEQDNSFDDFNKE